MVRSQVGVIWFRLRVRGFPVHVFEAGSGSNAIMAAYHLIHALQKLEAEWNERAKADRHFKALTHPINFNPGIIKGGDWASSVPAWCDVDCRIAVLPGWSVADCQKEILACVSAAARDHRFLSNNPPDVEWSGFLSEGYELKDSAAPEAAFGKAFSAVYGGAVQDLVFTALTDTRFYGLELQHPEPVLRRQRRGDARLQRICRPGLAAEVDQSDRAVHRGMVRGGEGVTSWSANASSRAMKQLRTPSLRDVGMRARSAEARSPLRPQRLHDRIEPVGQRRRSRLQDQRRLDLDDAVVAHGRNVAPSPDAA